MKKIIGFVMAVSLALTALSVTAFARNGRGIGNDLTLGRITFVMVERDNEQNVLGSFTTEEQIGRFRTISERSIPGWRVDRRAFRNQIRANRGSQTIMVPMVREEGFHNVEFSIRPAHHVLNNH